MQISASAVHLLWMRPYLPAINILSAQIIYFPTLNILLRRWYLSQEAISDLISRSLA